MRLILGYFLFQDVNLGLLATGFGLLQLPKMPELKNADTSGFVPEDVDTNSISFKDKQREAARQDKLATFKETGVWPSKKASKGMKKKSEPWAQTKARKAEKKEKKILRKKKKEELKEKGIAVVTKKRKRGVSAEDLQELANDIALMKKLKKKKVCSKIWVYLSFYYLLSSKKSYLLFSSIFIIDFGD